VVYWRVIGFPQHRLASLHELAVRVLDTRKLGCDSETLARDLLAGFFDVCMRSGLDGLLAEIEGAFPGLAIADGGALAEDARLRGGLIERLGNKKDFDGGPRNAKPKQLADHLLATLSLTLEDKPVRLVTLGDAVRSEVLAALAGVVDVAFAVPQLRDNIIAKGRELCDARYRDAFEKIAAHLDDRGMRMVRQPKISLDAVQAVQGILNDARGAVIGRAAREAIDRAVGVLARVDKDAAARIDQPITLRLTPRDVAIMRIGDPRLPKMPAPVVHSLFESMTELLYLAWRAVEKPVRTYAASQTFAVGDIVEHPKFGRGAVLSTVAQRIEVEFPDGKHTLVHVGLTKH
jgi:hypothetical protein